MALNMPYFILGKYMFMVDNIKYIVVSLEKKDTPKFYNQWPILNQFLYLE